MKIIRCVCDALYNEIVIDFDDGSQMSVNPNEAGNIFFHTTRMGTIKVEQESANQFRVTPEE